MLLFRRRRLHSSTRLAGALVTEIVNSGTIHGALNAIQASLSARFRWSTKARVIGDVVGALAAGADTIVNNGKIAGSLHLGGGSDTFNGGGGTGSDLRPGRRG